MLKVGEKVKYLNEEGEATILELVSSKIALVEDEHGFRHKHPTDQLVPADRHRVSEIKPSTPLAKIEKKPEKKSVDSKPKQKALPELALLFLSSNIKKPEIGNLELRFNNNSSYHLLVNISAKNGDEWFSHYHGEIKAGEQQPIQSIRRQDVGQVGNLTVDVIFYRNSGYQLRLPITSTVKIKATRFVKGGNYITHNELEAPSLIIPIEQDRSTVANVSFSGSVVRRSLNVVKPSLPIFEEEVDLHLEKLEKDHHSMADKEKLALQLRHFEQKLNNAIQKNYIQITFIHGVGKGKLKSEIRSILKEYGLKFQDGPYHKYGVGATVVRL